MNRYPDSQLLLKTQIHPTTYQDATQQILDWAKVSESRYVCAANTHLVMEAYDNSTFRDAVNQADMVTPDGMPLVWVLRRKGHDLKDRVYGPTLTLWVLEEAARQGIPVGFYGASPDVLAALIANIRQKFPKLNIAYFHSPPYRELTPEEDAAIVRDINTSGARILFVGLGCPKQERWMYKHSCQFSVVSGQCEESAEQVNNAGMLECWNAGINRKSATSQKNQIQAVMIGVGAAFDFHAGAIRQAPGWMQQRGLEWLFRLCVEPRRLWKRYLKHNPRFAVLTAWELLRERR